MVNKKIIKLLSIFTVILLANIMYSSDKNSDQNFVDTDSLFQESSSLVSTEASPARVRAIYQYDRSNNNYYQINSSTKYGKHVFYCGANLFMIQLDFKVGLKVYIRNSRTSQGSVVIEACHRFERSGRYKNQALYDSIQKKT